ncbi:MAG: mandelate racemase/muconate lactonizing enzyme family protein [Dehalococcoidia bacterium]
MRISSVDVFPVRLGYKSVRHFTGNILVDSGTVIVRVRTDDGLVGWGEASARPHAYGESQVSIADAIERHLGPAMVGRTMHQLDDIWDLWRQLANNHSAKAALDMALWDLRAKAAEVPLYVFLGGDQPTVPLSITLTIDDAPSIAEGVARGLEDGFTAFKVKVGEDLERDLDVMERLADILPERAHLQIDANQGYDLGDARTFIRAAHTVGAAFFEDPIRADDQQGRVELRALGLLPLSADDSARTLTDVYSELSRRASDLISIKVARTGITQSLKILAVVEAADAGAVIGTQASATISSMASAHIAAAVTLARRYPAEVSTPRDLEVDVVAGGPEMFEGGSVTLPDEPGLGVEPDETLLRRHAL